MRYSSEIMFDTAKSCLTPRSPYSHFGLDFKFINVGWRQEELHTLSLATMTDTIPLIPTPASMSFSMEGSVRVNLLPRSRSTRTFASNPIAACTSTRVCVRDSTLTFTVERPSALRSKVRRSRFPKLEPATWPCTEEPFIMLTPVPSELPASAVIGCPPLLLCTPSPANTIDIQDWQRRSGTSWNREESNEVEDDLDDMSIESCLQKSPLPYLPSLDSVAHTESNRRTLLQPRLSKPEEFATHAPVHFNGMY
jgi:hypothetical protein